ncbi:MAG: DNA-binding domain-containing protein [Desulfovibrio sp.]
MALKEAYTTKELATVLSVTAKTLLARGLREGWESRIRKARGGGNEWLVSSLPDAVRSQIVLQQAKTESAPALPEQDVVIPDWSHKLGMARYRVCHDWMQYVAKQKGTLSSVEATKAFCHAHNTGLMDEGLFETVGKVSKQTLYRWRKALKESGDDYRVLCDKRGKWNKGGAKGNGQIGAEAERYILGMYLTPNRPSMQLAYNSTVPVLQKHGLPVPSYSSVCRFLQRYDSVHHDLVVLKREGEKALKDKVGPYIARNDKMLAVGDVIFCDGHVLNFTCLHPKTGKAFRPTLICWFDWRSRMPVGWELMPTEDTYAISSALKMAVAHLGQYPKVSYIDNGKAFKSKYFTDTNADFKELDGLYARLGIAVQFSRPYEARTKIVERFFRTFDEQCQRLMPSYTGNNIDNKPAWRMRNEKYHQSRMDERVPTLTEAAEIFKLYVGWYGNQTHRGLSGKTPWEIFGAGQGEGVALDELERHFLFTKRVKPARCGFTIAGVRFVSDSLYGLNQHVLVKYSWADLSEVFLYTEDGHRLGTASPQEMLNPLAKHFGDELDMHAVREANKQQKILKRKTLELAKSLDGEVSKEALMNLPFMKPEPTPLRVVSTVDPVQEPKLDAAEIERLEAVKVHALNAVPQLHRPEFFTTELERYEWCFEQAVKNGFALEDNDTDFMSRYEDSEEYKDISGTRFEQLRQIYNRQHEAIAN